MQKTKIAICYDFDHTLSLQDMQGYGLIQSFKMTPDQFWKECREFESVCGSNYIMSYMYKILEKCNQFKIAPTRQFFASTARDIEYFKGVKTWFSRINNFAKDHGVELSHYIISSGLKEIVEGTPIAKYFTQIFACEYCYNKDGIAFGRPKR